VAWLRASTPIVAARHLDRRADVETCYSAVAVPLLRETPEAVSPSASASAAPDGRLDAVLEAFRRHWSRLHAASIPASKTISRTRCRARS
jgi:hypothetical protein